MRLMLCGCKVCGVCGAIRDGILRQCNIGIIESWLVYIMRNTFVWYLWLPTFASVEYVLGWYGDWYQQRREYVWVVRRG